MAQVAQAWAGIDAGKEHHHVVVIDGRGHQLMSRRVLNDESELDSAITAALERADEVGWAIDLADGPAALVITLLLERGQRLLFLPGIAVNRASDAYRGEGKTDANRLRLHPAATDAATKPPSASTERRDNVTQVLRRPENRGPPSQSRTRAGCGVDAWPMCVGA